VRQQGTSFPHPLLVVVVLPNTLEENKTAVIAGRSVGRAVQRNFAKRRLRAAFQSVQSDLLQGFDILLIARRPLLDASYHTLLAALQSLLDAAGLMKENVH
jgi:ribonuclease P protein component